MPMYYERDCASWVFVLRITGGGLPIPNIAMVPALDSDAQAAIRKREAKRAAEKAQQTPWENEQEAIRHSANTVKWRADEYRGGFRYWQSATEKPAEEHKIHDPEEVKKLKALCVPDFHVAVIPQSAPPNVSKL